MKFSLIIVKENSRISVVLSVKIDHLQKVVFVHIPSITGMAWSATFSSTEELKATSVSGSRGMFMSLCK